MSTWRLLDLAKAFVGLGSLDLATWQGTRNPPDADRLREQLHAYVAAGGDAGIVAGCGGLKRGDVGARLAPSLGRPLVLRQSFHGTTGIATDDDTAAIIRRQLTAAVDLLSP